MIANLTEQIIILKKLVVALTTLISLMGAVIEQPVLGAVSLNETLKSVPKDERATAVAGEEYIIFWEEEL